MTAAVNGWQGRTREELPAFPTLQQVADFLAVDKRTIRRWIAAGRLKAHRIGPRLIRIDRESIAAMGTPLVGGETE